MIKDLFLALILGALLGFGLTGGYFKFIKNKIPQNTPKNIPTPTISNQIPTPTIAVTENNIEILIDNPIENSIVSTSTITVTGTTSKNSYIIINTPVNTYNNISDDEGKFSLDINLELGINKIYITAINPEDKQINTEMYVTYSTSKI